MSTSLGFQDAGVPGVKASWEGRVGARAARPTGRAPLQNPGAGCPQSTLEALTPVSPGRGQSRAPCCSSTGCLHSASEVKGKGLKGQAALQTEEPQGAGAQGPRAGPAPPAANPRARQEEPPGPRAGGRHGWQLGARGGGIDHRAQAAQVQPRHQALCSESADRRQFAFRPREQNSSQDKDPKAGAQTDGREMVRGQKALRPPS